MKLYCEVAGNGPDLVFLHGWGMHSGLWTTIASALTDRYRVTLIDLPGHGFSERYDTSISLTDLAECLADLLPRPCSLAGWSLGGLAALQLAMIHPEQIEQIVLVTSSACFVKQAGWPNAMEQKVLADFHRRLEQEPDATLQRFVALQTFGSPEPQTLARLILKRLRDRTPADTRALLDGFNMLLHSDLRQSLSKLRCPVSLLLGSHDRIVPPGVGADMQRLLPAIRCYLFERGGHIPFLSHRHEFITALEDHITPGDHING